ncbi:MAG: structural protein [Roseococcus sp.]|nr:structural protein [Roseococcus sp.]
MSPVLKSMDPKATRGYRNRNPGNIEHVPTNKWQGLAEPPSDGRFCRFTSHELGIRALALLLTTYQDRHQLRTPRAIISRWAPKVENDTEAYIAAVSRRIGVGPDEAIDLHSHAHLRPLVEAIIHHECAGLSYPAAVIDRALTLAGAPPAPPVTLRDVAAITDTGRGAMLVGAAGIATAVVQATPAIQALGSLAPAVAIALIAAAVIGVLAWRLRRPA